MRQNWKWFWPHEHNTRAGHPYSGKLPAHPALCRVQKDGQWYVGAVSYATEFQKDSIDPYTYKSYSIGMFQKKIIENFPMIFLKLSCST